MTRHALTSFAKDDAIELLGLQLSAMEFLKQHGIRTARALIDAPWTLFPESVVSEIREHVTKRDHEAARALEVDGLLEALRARASPAYLQLPHRDALETLPEDKLPEALAALRDGLELGKRGGHAERLHAIVGLVGPSAPEVAAVLERPTHAGVDKVLEALRVRPRKLPLLPLGEHFVGWLVPLLETRHAFGAAALLARIPTPAAVEALLARTGDPTVINAVLRALGSADVARPPVELPAHAIATYLELAAKLAKKTADVPFEHLQRKAAFIASLAGRHDGLARATLTFLDRIPAERPDELAPFTSLVHASLQRLDASERERVAALLDPRAPARHPLGAAAWALLSPSAQLKLAQRLFGKASPNPDLADAEASMLSAMISAQRALGGAVDEALAGFFRSLAASGPLHLRRHALLAPGGATPEMIEQALRRATDHRALEAALELAANTGAPLGRAALAKLRDPKIRLEPRVLELLEKVLIEDDADWLEQEVDGDNPFADRRAALKAILKRLRR